MITKDSIKNLANKYQTTELNMQREYFQHLFLSYFYLQPQTSNIYFKGGTALRIIYKSPRFSEDLDFSATYSDIKEIEEAILNTLTEIQRENVKVALKESKQTGGGYLGIIEFDSILITLQISLRDGGKKGQVVTIVSDFIPPYTIVVLVKDQLVDEKMQALFTRQKPRDFFDFYFLLRANLISQEKRDLLEKALNILKTVDMNFEKELKQFLPKTHFAIIKDFKSTLRQEIERFI